MGMPLISRKWDKDQQELERVFRRPKTYKWPICQSTSPDFAHSPTNQHPVETLLLTLPLPGLISYSESTRYTPQKCLETIQWREANNKAIPRYTLYPRAKGFVVTVK